jgi:rubrerythrin
MTDGYPSPPIGAAAKTNKRGFTTTLQRRTLTEARVPRLSLKNALTSEFRRICSLEHGTPDTKPSAETSTTPDTSAATKTTQACATTRTQLMGETPLRPLKAILETIRERVDFALKQLQQSEEERSTRWRCKDCRYTKHFTRPVPLEAAGRCPRCKSISFQCVA